MSSDKITICDRLEQILESIELIEQWSENIHEVDDFMATSSSVMAFNACVMRLQVIGEQVGKLLKDDSHPLDEFEHIPWLAIYDMRNLISHEYSNINEIIVFSVIKEDLPQLKDVVEKLISKLQRS